MRKQILAVALAIMTMSAIPAYAASTNAQESNGITWLVPKGKTSTEYESEYGPLASDWAKAEAVAQVKKWAEENKGNIPSITDEKARYEAIVAKVCDFLTYDALYQAPHVVYSIRDGKGVCAEYTAFTRALCDVCNIQSTILDGRIDGAGHNMLKVVLNGQTYYSDPTNVDYSNQPVLTDSVPSYFTLDRELDSNINGAIYTGGSTDDINTLNVKAAKRGEAVIYSNTKGDWYGSIEDKVKLDKALEEDDDATVHAIWDKYGVPYLK